MTSLAERVGQALRRRGPEANQSGWRAKLADSIDVGESTLTKWWYGEQEPSATALLALFDKLGPEFEAEVRAGEPPPIAPADRIERVRAELREIERALAKAPVVAIPIRGKTT